MKKEENAVDLSTLESTEVAEAAAMSQKNRRHKRRMKLFGGAAALVVFVTTYMLILPAITLTGTPTCGIEEHTHTDSCYTEEQVLTCGQAESAGHTHTESCYDEAGNLICGMQETAGHTHTADCYTTERELTCTISEHVHSSNCYSQTNEDTDEASTSDAEDEASTSDAESSAEEDDDEALPVGDSTADVESAADWEATFAGVTLTGDWGADTIAIARTQIGYCESTANFISYKDENGDVVKKGYSRYAAWYHNGTSSYGDWCAMFCSFCYNYAGVPESVMPEHSGVPAWITLLNSRGQYHGASSGYVPKTGDLIFYDWESDGVSDHVALVEDCVNGVVYTIEGNFNDMVAACSYSYGDYRIMGYGELPEQNTSDAEEISLAAEVEDTAETVEADAVDAADDAETVEADEADAADDAETVEADDTDEADEADEAETSEETTTIPVFFELAARAQDGMNVTVSGDSSALPDYENVTVSINRLSVKQTEALAEDVGVDTERYDTAAYDVTLYNGDTEIEPEGTVTVTFQSESILGDAGTAAVYHFDDESDEIKKMELSGEDDGTVQFETDSFSKYLVTTEGVTYDSDLEDFLTSATMTDYAGNTITNGSTVYIGQDYTITMSFAESNVSGAEKQFHYDDEGYLTYQVDTTNLVLKEVTNAPITQADGTVVGHYWLSTDGTLKVKFDNVDNTGAAIDKTYFDEYKNTVFNLTFEATVTANSAGQKIEIPFSDDISITGKVDAGGDLEIEKTAGTVNSAKHSMDFTVKVNCTEGVVSNIVLTDTPNSRFKGTLYSATIDTESITFTDLNGNALTEQPTVTKNDDGTYTIKYPTSLQAGEGFLIKYNMIAGDDAYEAMTKYCLENDGTKVAGNVNFLNTVKVTGDNGTGTPVEKTKDAEKTSYTTLMGKSHSDTTIEDSNGNSIDVIKWTVSIGDNYKNFGGATLTDTIGSALTFLTDSGNYDYIKLWYKDQAGHASNVYYYFDEAKKAADTGHTTGLVTLSADGKTATITLPEDCCDCSLEYYTTYVKNIEGTDAYKNTASVTGTGYGAGKASDSSTAGVGVPNIEKTTTGADANYIYYKITVDVPASMYGEYINIMDRGIDTNTGGIGFGCRMELCENFKVTVQKDSDSSPVEYTYSSRPGTGTYNWQGQDGGNYWSLWLNNSTSSTDQKWPINEHSVLTITFAYPRTVVSEGKSINDVLWDGYYVRNQARVYYVSNKNQKTVYTTYYTTSEMNKTGQKTKDGRMYYEVGYATYATDNTTNTRTAAMEKPFSNAYLYDDYDAQTTFDSEYGIQCCVLNVKTNKKAYFQVDSANIEFNDSGSSFKAYWKNFIADDDYSDLGVTKGTNMETFLNSQDLANYKLYFMYYMTPTPTHEAIESSPNQIVLNNTAKIGYRGTTDYETKGVTFNYTYTTAILDKKGTQKVSGGNEIDYTIDLNSDCLDLSDGDTYQVEDQMSDNMTLYLDSIVFSPEDDSCQVSYDETNHKIVFTVPDSKHVTITYTTKIGETGTSVKVSNTATIKGLTSKSSGGEATYEVTNTSGSAAGSKKYLYVLKQNSMTKDSVIGAKIALYGETDKGITAPEGVDQTITVNGKTLYYYATFESSENDSAALDGTFQITDDYLADGGFYALKEIEAPEGYLISEDPIPFYWEIEKVSEKDGYQVKHHHDTLIFQNTPESYSLPSTGGSGTRMFTLGGIALMLAALVIGFGSRRRRERRAAR